MNSDEKMLTDRPCHKIIENLLTKDRDKKCDFRRISYHILSQAIREAEFHRYSNTGERGEMYRQTMLFLEDVLEEIGACSKSILNRGGEKSKKFQSAISISSILIMSRHVENIKYLEQMQRLAQ